MTRGIDQAPSFEFFATPDEGAPADEPVFARDVDPDDGIVGMAAQGGYHVTEVSPLSEQGRDTLRRDVGIDPYVGKKPLTHVIEPTYSPSSAVDLAGGHSVPIGPVVAFSRTGRRPKSSGR